MFESLSQGFSSALEKLTKQGVLREDEISTALREVRVALLEADVTLEITKRFIKYWQPELAIFVDSEIWPNMFNNFRHD